MGRKAIGFDKKPQFMRMSVSESAANTYTESSANTPNLTEAGFVMEILKVFWEVEGAPDAAADDSFEFALQESSRATIPNLSTAGVVIKFNREVDFTTSGLIERDMYGMFDLTDGAGNGYLFGRKEIIASVVGSGQGSAIQTIHFAILYRLIKVTPAELVGLISS